MTAEPLTPSNVHREIPATGEGFVLTLDCVENPGIVHAVSHYLLEHGCYISNGYWQVWYPLAGLVSPSNT